MVEEKLIEAAGDGGNEYWRVSDFVTVSSGATLALPPYPKTGLHGWRTVKTHAMQGTRPERPNETLSLDVHRSGMKFFYLPPVFILKREALTTKVKWYIRKLADLAPIIYIYGDADTLCIEDAKKLTQYLTHLNIEESKPAPKHFTFSGYRSQPNSISISLGKFDSARFSNALSKNSVSLEQKSYTRSLSHHITRKSDELTTSTVTTYFIQEKLQPIDLQLLWKERCPYLRIDGLQTVSYDGTKRLKARTMPSEEKVQNVVFPDQVLEVDLSETGITKDAGLIRSTRTAQNQYAKNLCGFMEQLTGYELLMLCHVKKVKVGPPEGNFLSKLRQRKRGAALLLLWRSPDDSQDSNKYWVTLRLDEVDESHGEKQWLHGKRK